MAELSPQEEHAGPAGIHDQLERRGQIAALESLMLGLSDDQKLSIEAMTFHYLASGAYVREMRIPKGVVVVGKIHRTPHIAILMQGRVTITTEKGSETHDAPKIMLAPPGTKRVAFAHTDAIWCSVHVAGDETDPQKIEERLIAPSFDEFEPLSAAQSEKLEVS